ncbi:DUF2252 family protein [Nocardia sp. NPDC046473]|uniref:DUF2252 family protein n=1 Tax=Nocardia sp. NPDC046473 TaxID=3155733 RepID=UPI0033FB0339
MSTELSAADPISPPSARVRALPAIDRDSEAGRAARARVPRRSAGEWNPNDRTVSALGRLQAQEAVRDAELLPLRYARMSSSAWAYLRGAAAVMAADLATREHSGLMVQMCGDAHILNFGLWASPERQLLFDARDFDETLPGPFEWDLKRLCTSVYVLAATEGIATSTADAAATAAVDGYRSAMRRYANSGELEVWYDRITADVPLQHLTSQFAKDAKKTIGKASKKRSQEGTARQLVTEENGQRRIAEDPIKRRHVSLTDADEIRVYEQIFDTYLASIPPHLIRLVGRFSRLDTVQQVVGVGSVGMRVYLHLMEGDSGELVFFQMKQATASVYEEFLGASAFGNHGERVCVGQRLMQSASDIFLGHVRADGDRLLRTTIPRHEDNSQR